MGGDSGWLHIPSFASKSAQLIAGLSTQGSCVDPVGGIGVDTGEPSAVMVTFNFSGTGNHGKNRISSLKASCLKTLKIQS